MKWRVVTLGGSEQIRISGQRCSGEAVSWMQKHFSRPWFSPSLIFFVAPALSFSFSLALPPSVLLSLSSSSVFRHIQSHIQVGKKGGTYRVPVCTWDIDYSCATVLQLNVRIMSSTGCAGERVSDPCQTVGSGSCAVCIVASVLE